MNLRRPRAAMFNHETGEWSEAIFKAWYDEHFVPIMEALTFAIYELKRLESQDSLSQIEKLMNDGWEQ